MLKDVSPYHLTGVGITERLVTLKNVSNSTLNIELLNNILMLITECYG